MSEEPVSGSDPDRVAIFAIVMTGIITLACILACTIVSIVFIINAPW